MPLAIALAYCFATGSAGLAAASASELRRTAIVIAGERVRPSIVNIHGEKTIHGEATNVPALEADRRVNGMGTGVVIDPRGYIITNHHVVDGVENIRVNLADGSSYVALLVSRDPVTDLALIKIDAAAPLAVVPIGTSSDLMAGEPVVAVGNAFGYEHTVTRGIISALHRTVQVSEGQKYEDLIQTDASINPGNSGGPLLNIDGELIGINVAVRAGAQGIGFAIPVDKVTLVAADLMSVRRLRRTWHGVVSNAETHASGGLLVASTDADSPAAKCGLEPGDTITEVNGSALARAVDLERALLDHEVGDEVELSVVRDNRVVKLSLQLAALPAHLEPVSDPMWHLLGLRLKPIAAKQFQRFNSRYRGGLSVIAVRPDSRAAKQGISRGDVLVGMHIWETVSLENVDYILNRPDFAQLNPLKFYILRGNDTFYVHLPVSAERR